MSEAGRNAVAGASQRMGADKAASDCNRGTGTSSGGAGTLRLPFRRTRGPLHAIAVHKGGNGVAHVLLYFSLGGHWPDVPDGASQQPPDAHFHELLHGDAGIGTAQYPCIHGLGEIKS